jgi:hypothetical protein
MSFIHLYIICIGSAAYIVVGYIAFSSERYMTQDNDDGAWLPLLIAIFWPVVLLCRIGITFKIWLVGK